MNALRIGLTGGIGSGKTTVAKLFELLAVPVYYADEAAKNLMNTDEKLKSDICKNFGEQAYKNNVLDRSFIASVVFNDPGKLDLLNAIVHPATINDAEQWIKRQTSPYVIKEAALLFESGADKMLDYVIGVKAAENLRIERAMKRDSLNRDEVIKRLSRQMNEEEKMKRCDFILINDETQLLIPQVLELHQKLISLSHLSDRKPKENQ
ncbi:MAG: dephospho-CoA kinase [Bacteroidetes bacterium]|nr:dephospho-CoA kinase [Bacteroidota bacterium]MBS1930664.1 dephospho-CoA kinase [Bacteroidota bacterium]